jgi:exodeoxyribonuclease VIII
VYQGLPFKSYQDRKGISKSDLDLIHKSPLAYYSAKIKGEHGEQTKSMRRGSLVHNLLLEDNFKLHYAVTPPVIKIRRGKAWDDFLAENADREIISAAEYEEAVEMAKAVKNNPTAANIIDNANYKEISIFKEDFSGYIHKCRPDIIYDRHIFDIKTSQDISAEGFAGAIKKYRYHVQAAYYLNMCDGELDSPIFADGFGFIVVSTTKPYECTVFMSLDDSAIDAGREEYTQDLITLSRCLENNEWPGVPEVVDVININ